MATARETHPDRGTTAPNRGAANDARTLRIALVAGGLVGGVLGAIIAIPLFGVIRVLVVRVGAPIL